LNITQQDLVVFNGIFRIPHSINPIATYFVFQYLYQFIQNYVGKNINPSAQLVMKIILENTEGQIQSCYRDVQTG